MSPPRSRSGRPPETPALFDLSEEPIRTEGHFVEVALDRPVRQAFTYAVADELAPRAVLGSRVAVPFGRGRLIGVVVRCMGSTEIPVRKLRTVIEVLDEEPVVDAGLLELTRWIAERYGCAWGEALAAVLPAALKRSGGSRQVLVVETLAGVGAEQLAELEDRFPKQHRLLRTLLELEGRSELRDVLRGLNLSESPARSLERRGWVRIQRVTARPGEPAESGVVRVRPETLSEDQERALARIRERLERREHGAFLLEGVTGSGKTEVYLRAIETALAQGRSAIVLVPEIALTPQTLSWFRSRFGDVSILHSRLTDAQRLDMWRRLRHGRARVVVGARSAVFAPLSDLGVLVVDEEHEPTFKQSNVPRYHARDVALERARREGAVCILGSATPSLESWEAAERGELERLALPSRVGGGRMPRVDVVDLRIEGKGIFSRPLVHALEETLEAGEQAILFQNRRGFVPVLWCRGCATTLSCGQCDLALTLHRRIQRLVCHACCDEIPVPVACPTCSKPGLQSLGVGSERVEAELRRLFPEARVKRMDSDTMRRREDYETTLEAFHQRELDVLVGTQMIAKGLDFPGVTLVGIISADQNLHLPDFRAAERTFQLVSQVSGRAGRGELPGRIIVQTLEPKHAAIVYAVEHDYPGFARQENALRKELGYPPHGRLLRAVFEDEKEEAVQEAARRTAELLHTALTGTSATVLGPAPAPVAVLRNRHRHHLLVKTERDDPVFKRAVALLVEELPTDLRPAPKVDVDPTSML